MNRFRFLFKYAFVILLSMVCELKNSFAQLSCVKIFSNDAHSLNFEDKNNLNNEISYYDKLKYDIRILNSKIENIERELSALNTFPNDLNNFRFKNHKIKKNVKSKNVFTSVNEKESENIDIMKNEIIEKDQSKIDSLKNQLTTLKDQLYLFNRQKEYILPIVKIKMEKIMRDHLNDFRFKSALTDVYSFNSIINLNKDFKITLLLGNRWGQINNFELSQIKLLVEKFVSLNYHIVFEADSVYAGVISSLAGNLGIPVIGKDLPSFSNHPNKVVIYNDYLRMKALSSSKAVIINPDSVSGKGFFIEGLATHMFDYKRNTDISFFDNWTRELNKKGRNLGVSSHSIKKIQSIDELFTEPTETKFKFAPFTTPAFPLVNSKQTFILYTPENTSVESNQTILQAASSFRKVMIENSNTGGSVIFGSSSEDAHSANLIYQSAYKLSALGIAVATGGSGGAMKIANMGAWNAGGESIGIPIGGKHILKNETDFETNIHSRTIITSGYEERIPALLGVGRDSRKIIIFAPGGGGTLKELATTLIRMSSRMEKIKKIIFLDSEYYAGLVKWLLDSSLPQVIKDKIVLTDSAFEVEKIGLELQENFEKDRMSPARNNQETYEIKRKDSKLIEKANENWWVNWFLD